MASRAPQGFEVEPPFGPGCAVGCAIMAVLTVAFWGGVGYLIWRWLV